MLANQLNLSGLDFSIAINVRFGKTYLKAAKSCIEKGSDYAKNEIERLQRMLEKVGDTVFLFLLDCPEMDLKHIRYF